MRKIYILFCMFIGAMTFAQTVEVSGKISDTSNEPLIGASILVKGTTKGTTTDFDGSYKIQTEIGKELEVSYIGFKTQVVKVTGKEMNVVLSEDTSLEEVVLTGSRTAPRSNTSSALPIDVITSKDIISTGQVTIDKAMQFKIPSFNTVQTPVNDATSLLDPYEIRNMGPSRTLILINGKRKNLSALLYTQTSPGRGETGSDISGIPIDAIKDIQVLRDGASAQYGSDAIAGVINIILKDNSNTGSATLRTGISGEGDGEMIGFSVNNGSSIGDNKGFINYTIDLSKVNLANRPGTVNALAEADGNLGFGADLGFVQEFLRRKPDAGNVNGSPETAAAKFLMNGSYNLSNESKLYFNGAFINKKVNSFANYRTPYWRTVEDYPYLADFYPGNNPTTAGGYDGYVPTFEGDLNDYNATIGVNSKINDWQVDASFTTGGNSQTYKVNNSHNRNSVFSPAIWVDTNGNGLVDAGEMTQGSQLYRENSKKSFNPGGTSFTHHVGNIDISKELNPNLSFALGTEFRYEIFDIIAGELGSYDGGGADSFAGNRPEDSGTFTRYNFGGYASLNWNPLKELTLDGTIRAENYSDFGNAFVWKASGAYTISDKYTLRSSISTGFRAPTLHQIYTQKAQYSFIPGEGIQVGGLINNVSPQAGILGVPSLKEETSTNFTIGLGGKVTKNISFTLDYYSINVKDRIILSTELTPPAEPAFAALSDVSFFSNAIDTKTSGIDLVLSYNRIELGSGKLGFNLSGNYTIKNERDGAVRNPTSIESTGQTLVNQTQEALFFTSRPKTKSILNITYNIGK